MLVPYPIMDTFHFDDIFLRSINAIHVIFISYDSIDKKVCWIVVLLMFHSFMSICVEISFQRQWLK